jgi:hypothetical protein
MKIRQIIDGLEYLNIKQAYSEFGEELLGKPTYNTFYKKFIRYKAWGLKGVKIGSIIYYLENDFISFIDSWKGVRK